MSFARITGIRLAADGVCWEYGSAVPKGTENRVMWNTARRKRAFASSGAPAPRLCLGPGLPHCTVLDGGWWPRSADPAAELPGLISAIDDRRGRVTRVMLGPAGWDSQP